MNSLSWFVYLIQVIPTAGGIALAASIFTAIAYSALWIVRAFQFDICYSESDRRLYEEKKKPIIVSIQKKLISIFCVAILFVIFLPERKTMIMIAASEVGEKVFQNQKMKDILDPSVELLQEWIKKELKTIKEPNVPTKK